LLQENGILPYAAALRVPLHVSAFKAGIEKALWCSYRWGNSRTWYKTNLLTAASQSRSSPRLN